MLTNSTSLIGGIRWLHLSTYTIFKYYLIILFKLNRFKWGNGFFKQGQRKTLLDKYLFNSSFILYVSGWFRSHWKRMEVCCHGFRQGLPDSLYVFYCATFGSCLNSSTSCNSWIRGHSLITLARFWPFLTTYLPRVDISSTTYLPTLSCRHSLWMLPQKEQILLKAISKNKWFFTFNDEDSDKDEKHFFSKKRGDFKCL